MIDVWLCVEIQIKITFHYLWSCKSSVVKLKRWGKLKCSSDLRWISHCGHWRKTILNYRIDIILQFLYHEKFYDNLEKVVVTKTVTTSVTRRQSREADLYQKASIVKTETENSMNAKGYKMIDSEETNGNWNDICRRWK